ncbi:hypothetical protein B0I35DRAFT_411175 [Stachybotrys elegans]|uniref:Uncharacterized protein n=1 Tax=Stachybotrys elegans TaxID=80388 RepID=A0A8K0SHM4_9HYPO|nr:hypothetical protein B0I35DRAFT_411175 [Stachybotrys elegans]
MEASQKATVVPIAQEAAAKQDPAIDRFEELCRPSHPTPPEIDISGRNEHLRTRILEGLQRVDDTGVENNDLQNMHGTSSNDGRLFASKSEPKATLGRQLHHLIDRRFVKERESLTRYSETNTSHFESHVQAARKMVKESRHDRRRLVADLEKVLTQKTESHSESRYRLQQIERHVVDKYGIEMRETV